MRTYEPALLLYSTMIFAAVDSGSFILRFRQKKKPIFWPGGPQIHRHRKSVAYNNILFDILSKYSTKKKYLNYDRVGDRLF